MPTEKDNTAAPREKRPELLSMSFEELSELLTAYGEPAYRASQIFPQLHRGISPEKMTNISAATKRLLAEKTEYFLPAAAKRLVSAVDGTVKYLFSLADGNCIETVLMRYRHGNTVCLSSQVGCRMGCAFCASTIGGKVRDLSAGEILGQVIAVAKDTGERVGNIVMMGIGEPMDNYGNLLKFLHLVNDGRGINIGYRHISVSTCGHADGIRRFAAEKLPVTLSISLHASDDETRSGIMPVNRRWNISELMDACRVYRDSTGRRISFEYTLIKGRNSGTDDALRLAGLLNSELRRDGPWPIHVNLIPVNPVEETGLLPPDRQTVAAFAAALERKGIRATVRRTLGPDINASCGQLRRNNSKASGKERTTCR